MCTSSCSAPPTGGSCGRWRRSGATPTFLEADGSNVTGHFRAIDPLADPQGELSLGFGGDATKVGIRAQLTAGHHIKAERMRALADSNDTGDGGGDDQAQGQTSLGGQTTLLMAPTDVFGEVDATARPRPVWPGSRRSW